MQPDRSTIIFRAGAAGLVGRRDCGISRRSRRSRAKARSAARPIKLGYTQSAVSQQIATLERIVGEPLFERPGGPRPVSLTEAGRAAPRTRPNRSSRGSAGRPAPILAALAAGEAGSLHVGTFQSVGGEDPAGSDAPFPPGAWPDVGRRALGVAPRTASSPTVVERGELDVAFVQLPARQPVGSRRSSCYSDDYVLVASPRLLAREPAKRSTMREIAAEPLIGYRTCRTTELVVDQLRDERHRAVTSSSARTTTASCRAWPAPASASPSCRGSRSTRTTSRYASSSSGRGSPPGSWASSATATATTRRRRGPSWRRHWTSAETADALAA